MINSSTGVNSVLIDFNMIIDTDFGLLTLIDREYLDNEVFSVDWFNQHHIIKELVKALYEREERNPLSEVVLKEKVSYDTIEQLYSEFISTKKTYNEILNLSMVTEIYNLIESFKSTGDINIGIVCNNQEELDFLNTLKVTKPITKFLLFDLSPQIISKYNQFYIKYTDSMLTKFISDIITTKTVYFANYKFNINDEKKTVNINKYTDRISANMNNLGVIDIYNKNNFF